MAKLKLLIDDFDEPDFSIIAIHTVLEDYRLAFFLNKFLKLSLTRGRDINLKTKNGSIIFRSFVFENGFDDSKWTLIQNKNELTITEHNNQNDLFFNEKKENEIKIFLLPEFKQVDYFLKIEHPDCTFDPTEIIKNTAEIYNLSTAYQIENDNIKSKNNLIF